MTLRPISSSAESLPVSGAPQDRSVAILSSASGGGAGIAAKRMCDALNAHGTVRADFIEGAVLGEMLPQDAAPRTSLSNRTISDTHFTVEYPGFARGWLIEMLRGYDLVNVHWSSFLVSLAELHGVAASGTPMLFTLHDFHYITGGCHYPATCRNLSEGCISCPQVDTARCSIVQIQTNLAIKREIMAFPNVHLSAPSAYLRDQAVASGIVPPERAHVLRNAYRPLLPAPERAPDPAQELRILLIADSLTEGRKKMALAISSLGAFALACRQRGLDLSLTVDVVGQADERLKALLAQADVPHTLHGRISDHAVLSRVLAASDMMLTCSNEDNWPNILTEAGAYGCMPVVGPGHGCEEFVRTYGFGQVSRDYSLDGFVTAMLAAVAERPKAQFARVLHQVREDHAPETVARAYRALIDTIGGTSLRATA